MRDTTEVESIEHVWIIFKQALHLVQGPTFEMKNILGLNEKKVDIQSSQGTKEIWRILLSISFKQERIY